MVRDFCHVISREKAALGFFICMGDVTKPMVDEATKQGFWTDAGGRDCPKVQLLTVADLLDHKAKQQKNTTQQAMDMADD